MDVIKILILSIVQGITELLPISSSGHIIVIGKLLDFDISSSPVFLATLHLGTTLAIIVFFRKKLFKNFFTKTKLIFFLKLLLASLPVALIGLFFEDYIVQSFYNNFIIAISLITIGILFIYIEHLDRKTIKLKLEKIPLVKMMPIGIGQTLALIPGISRSGITTLAGMSCGLDKYSALKFSFILGIPLLLGGSLFEIITFYLTTDNKSLTTTSLSLIKILPAMIVTFIIGYLALHIIEKFRKKKWLTIFGVYRIVVGILILIFAI
ncbi:undecaprenyl-diphosphate phosphatase [bacterium]|nr:undecaprenyl-diphosphate phosphatase [bacterium]